MDCPQCHHTMEEGYLAFYDSRVTSRLVWQAEQPGYVRVRRPPGSVVVARAPLLPLCHRPVRLVSRVGETGD